MALKRELIILCGGARISGAHVPTSAIMHFQQVALAVLAFSSSRGAGLESSPHSLVVIPSRGFSRIVVEQDLQDPSAWQVRINSPRRTPVYLPAVTTQEGLQDALTQAWQIQHPLNAPVFLTRFLEPPTSSPPRSASPPRRRTGVSQQTFPRHE